MISYTYVLLFLSTFLDSVSSLKQGITPILSNNINITRRNLIKLIPMLTLVKPLRCNAEEENKPLTPQEMEEYNRLLEEAKRIQSIIDANIKASDEAFNKRLKDLGKK